MKKPSYIVILLMAAFIFTGCGKQSTSSVGPLGTPDQGTETGDGNDGTSGGGLQDFDNGSTVALEIASLEKMSDFVLRPLNNPTGLQINVALEEWGEGTFGGIVRIAYMDNGELKVNEFNAGRDEYDVQHNIWFEKNGKEIFHGFFEDENGALIVVIDNVMDLGDGASGDAVSGSVWYKNFEFTMAPNPSNGCLPGFGCPDTRCWFVEIGPYECRSFLQSDEIETTSMVYPNNGYVKLGEFYNLSRSKAFIQ